MSEPVPAAPPAPAPARWRALASGAPDLALGLVFAATWIRPTLLGERTVRHLVMVVLLEFFVVHSAAFLGSAIIAPTPKRTKIVALLCIGAFYSLFVGGFALAFRSAFLFIAFWSLLLNRLTGVLFGQAPTGQEKAFLAASWIAGAVCYVAAAAVTSAVPLPPLGITPAVIGAQKFVGTGLWVERPQHALALGFLYFMAIGLFEILWQGQSGEDPKGPPGPPQAPNGTRAP